MTGDLFGTVQMSNYAKVKNKLSNYALTNGCWSLRFDKVDLNEYEEIYKQNSFFIIIF